MYPQVGCLSRADGPTVRKAWRDPRDQDIQSRITVWMQVRYPPTDQASGTVIEVRHTSGRTAGEMARIPFTVVTVEDKESPALREVGL